MYIHISTQMGYDGLRQVATECNIAYLRFEA